MSNTIDLLNNVGSDASLRHAKPEDLVASLAQMQASEELKHAAMSGNKSHLAQELGSKVNMAVESAHNPVQTRTPDEQDDDPDDEQSTGGDGKDDRANR